MISTMVAMYALGKEIARCQKEMDGFDDDRSWEDLPEVDGEERCEDERFDGDVDYLTYPEYA
jgi:hypothetical protein